MVSLIYMLLPFKGLLQAVCEHVNTAQHNVTPDRQLKLTEILGGLDVTPPLLPANISMQLGKDKTE